MACHTNNKQKFSGASLWKQTTWKSHLEQTKLTNFHIRCLLSDVGKDCNRAQYFGTSCRTFEKEAKKVIATYEVQSSECRCFVAWLRCQPSQCLPKVFPSDCLGRLCSSGSCSFIISSKFHILDWHYESYIEMLSKTSEGAWSVIDSGGDMTERVYLCRSLWT